MFGDVQNPVSLHAFGYGNGNPLRFTDPTGERGEWASETASMARFEARIKEMEDYYNSGGALWKAWNSFGVVHDSVRTRIKHARSYLDRRRKAIQDAPEGEPVVSYRSATSVANEVHVGMGAGRLLIDARRDWLQQSQASILAANERAWFRTVGTYQAIETVATLGLAGVARVKVAAGPPAPQILPPGLTNPPPRMTGADAARALVGSAREAEPHITGDILGIAKETGGTPAGLNFRFKSEGSLREKIEKRGRWPGEINDVLRFTLTYEPDALAAGASRSIAELEAAGYTKVQVSNTFTDGVPYKGINTTFRAPSGLEFEVQFHTPQSFNVKQNVNHPLYELLRVLPKGDPRIAEIRDLMIRNSASIPTPEGVPQAVPNYRE